MSEHEERAPGRWQVRGENQDWQIEITESEKVICLVLPDGNQANHCNARLIAAAPTLRAERDEARAQRDALAKALRKLETTASYLMENYLQDETEDRNLAQSDDHWAALSLVVAALGDARAALEKTRGA